MSHAYDCESTTSSIQKSVKSKDQDTVKMELKAKNSKSSTNNQNVNSININQGNESKDCVSQRLSSPANLDSVHSDNQHSVESVNQLTANFKLDQFNADSTVMASSTNSPSSLNQSLNSSSCLTVINSDHSFNSTNFNSQLNATGDLENNPHLINRPPIVVGSNSSSNSVIVGEQVANNRNSKDAIPITNQINFNCSSQKSNGPAFFNQPDAEQLNNFDTFSESTTSKATSFLTKETCATCSNQIIDRYLLKVNGVSYHEKCCLCCCCGSVLNNVCYQKNSQFYCKHDYQRSFFRQCYACKDAILPKELVMKIYTDGEAIFHLKCFACHCCTRSLEKGDRFSFNNGLLICDKHLQIEQIETNKTDHLLLTSSTIINSPSNNLCQQSTANQLPITLNNPLNSSMNGSLNSNQSLHLQARTTLCNLSNSLQNNLPNSLSNADLQANANNLNNLMICSSNNLTLSAQIKLNEELNKESHKESLVRNRTDGRRGPKRPRTILTTAQRRAFKNSFEISQKPCRKVREGLAKETGLSVRIVQVWFQNQRASRKKERRRLEGKMMQQSSNLNNGMGSQTDLSLYNQNGRLMMKEGDDKLKNMHHSEHSMNPHLQTSFSNDESRSQITDSDEDFEHFQFINSPNDTGSYYSQSSYSKSINGDLEEDNLGEEENCLHMGSNRNTTKFTCNKKNCNNLNSNSNSFEFTNNSNSVFAAGQTNVNFASSENSTPLICAVAQAISSSNDILTTNCATPLSKSNSSTINSTNQSSNNGLEFAQNTSNTIMTPIDKLYSMQSSYFSMTENCENCLTSN